MKAARAVEDPAERLKHYTAAAQILLKELPIIYISHRQWIYAFNTKVEGFTPYPDGLIRPQGIVVK